MLDDSNVLKPCDSPDGANHEADCSTATWLAESEIATASGWALAVSCGRVST